MFVNGEHFNPPPGQPPNPWSPPPNLGHPPDPLVNVYEVNIQVTRGVREGCPPHLTFYPLSERYSFGNGGVGGREIIILILNLEVDVIII